MNIRLIARAITYDPKAKKILLVKNKGADFWYPPGGAWKYEREDIKECARREVWEETGIKVTIQKLLYAQEFHESDDMIFFETFWLAELAYEQSLSQAHIDHDSKGSVEQAQWFSQEDLKDLTIFPKRLKSSFWSTIDKQLLDAEDSFIGVKFYSKKL